MSSLRQEIELNREYQGVHEEALLSVVWTYQKMSKLGADFFKAHGLTDTQFNALMIINDYQKTGIRQFELARRLLINRASTGTLLDVLEKKGWIQRVRAADDRRAFELRLTDAGRELLTSFRPAWYELVARATANMDQGDLRQLVTLLEQFRNGVTAALRQQAEVAT